MSALATITVGALAEQAGVDIETILYFERLGLIDKPRRTVDGLKLYRTEDAARLTFIRRTKELGFSTEAIRELLGMSGKGPHTCSTVHDVAERHLLDIRRRMADLARLESVLAPLVAACPQTGGIAQCPIVSALSHPV
jgi:MerR family mercuric resistance operon transcriptional regulator